MHTSEWQCIIWGYTQHNKSTQARREPQRGPGNYYGGALSQPVLDHTRIIKYHTLKYLRIVKKITYAYDTRIITQVGRKDKVHTEGLHYEASVAEGGMALPNKSVKKV